MHPYQYRFDRIMADPYNSMIPRVDSAGTVKDGVVTMHNGLKVKAGCYYDTFSDILILNKGVHEPCEEFWFNEVIKTLPECPKMVEVGSYWAFYSMCLLKERPKAECLMIEPDFDNLQAGFENFLLNGFVGSFVQGKHDDVTYGECDILHADIQGAELQLLESIDLNLVTHFFISTHTQELHYSCLSLLKQTHEIIFEADLEKTFIHDGVICTRRQDKTTG